LSNSVDPSTETSGLTPQQRLESPNTRLVDAGIAAIKDMEALRECIAYEIARSILPPHILNEI